MVKERRREMAEDDSEKQFQKIMDKLFHAPSSVGLESGKKRVRSIPASRPELSSRGDHGFRGSLVPVGSQAPPCRPWDRGDLMRRLATFKSMTWFGKPKVVSPVNCACRGWVNVEIDTIACEACGARLLFSTPSSWRQQQVEKVAAVFSLKLDIGHKLHCPWINNACDEKLALFPPMPAPTLIEGYKERSRALLQLSALPRISSSAIDSMRSPQLETFLAQSDHSLGVLDDATQPSGSAGSKELINESEAVSANLYHQALKIISLCGWEPHLLPYAVDSEDQSTQSAEDVCSSETAQQFGSGQNPSLLVYSSTASDDVTGVKEDDSTSVERQSDPASVVLKCKLCGASVGLWAFSTVPRPLEFFRLTESTEMNDQINSSSRQGLINIDDPSRNNPGLVNTGANGSAMLRERPSGLNLSIAGGPPPTKQSFRAKVSLPIISRHLRSAFSSGIVQENVRSDLQGNNPLQSDKDDHVDDTQTSQDVRSENLVSLKCKNTFLDQSQLNVEIDGVENASRSEGTDMINNQNPLNEQEQSSVNQSHNMQTVPHNLGRDDVMHEDTENPAVDAGNKAVARFQVQDCLSNNPETNETVEHGKDVLREDPINCIATQDSHDDSVCVSSCLEGNATVDNTHSSGSKGVKGSDLPNAADPPQCNKNGKRVNDIVQTSDINGNIGPCGSRNDQRLVVRDKKTEFDPLRQHKHFCPWIVSTDVCKPGWKLTLSALDHTKVSSHALPSESTGTSPMIYEVDDPITSVCELFMSPCEKRRRLSRGSN